MTLISARELSKHYPGVHALDGLTLDLEPGIIGFVGANGAGKSTFIRILLGLLLPTSGTVSVLGFDTRANPLEIRRLVGYMPEHDCLPLDISGTDFVSHMGQMSGLPFTAARERAAEMLRHVGLHGHEAADQAGAGAGARSPFVTARRAHQWAGSGRA
jgi:ABC-2 type transport system ATP-binding protein